MGFVYAAIAILFLIYLVLRILRMLGGTHAIVRAEPKETFSGDRFNSAPLPARSAAQAVDQANALNSEWVTYPGATPPLKLKITGQSYESYRRVVRKKFDLIGQHNLDRLSPDQMAELNRSIVCEAYVSDWEGAQFPNGSAMQYTPADLAILMAKDPHLESFVTDQAKRISPPWPEK